MQARRILLAPLVVLACVTPSLPALAGVEADIETGVVFASRAETSLYGPEVRRKTNIGFVPLLNAHLEWRPRNGPFGLVVDVDALAAPQGRAEDVLIAAMWTPRPGMDLRLGYRTVEGGADNDEVYSFAWLHSVVAGLALTF